MLYKLGKPPFAGHAGHREWDTKFSKIFIAILTTGSASAAELMIQFPRQRI